MFEEKERLQAAWAESWIRYGARTNPYPPFYELYDNYSVREGGYHVPGHLVFLLDAQAEVFDMVTDPSALSLATLAHDVKQHPWDRSFPDERASALWLFSKLVKGRVSETRAARPAEMVYATNHKSLPDPKDIDLQVLLDSDMSILGAPPLTFDKYEAGIRNEYWFLTDREYNAGRLQFVTQLLDRSINPTIFYLSHFIERYEEPARENLDRSVLQLKMKLYNM